MSSQIQSSHVLKASNMFKHHLILLPPVICALFIYTEQQIRDPAFFETFKAYRAECAKEVNIDEDVVHKAWKENHFPTDNAFKCFFKCLNLKLGVMDNNGDVVDDVLKTVSAQFVDETTNREIVEECGAIKGADLCETAFKLMVCIKQAEID